MGIFRINHVCKQTGPKLSQELLELARDRGRISVAEAVKILAANRNTVKKHLQKLTNSGRLELQGKGRGVYYVVSDKK